MSISEKMKAINNKIEQTKAHCNEDRQNNNMSGLLLGNVAAIKRFEYSSSGKVSKAQNSEIIKKEKPTLENYSKSDLIYNSSGSFDKNYHDSIKAFISSRLF